MTPNNEPSTAGAQVCAHCGQPIFWQDRRHEGWDSCAQGYWFSSATGLGCPKSEYGHERILSPIVASAASTEMADFGALEYIAASNYLRENYEWDKSGRGYIRKSDNQLMLISMVMAAYATEATAKLQDKVDYANTEMKAVWDYVQKVSPWSESNEMDWSDEVICGIGFILQRAETAERDLDAERAQNEGLREALEHALTCGHKTHGQDYAVPCSKCQKFKALLSAPVELKSQSSLQS